MLQAKRCFELCHGKLHEGGRSVFLLPEPKGQVVAQGLDFLVFSSLLLLQHIVLLSFKVRFLIIVLIGKILNGFEFVTPQTSASQTA